MAKYVEIGYPIYEGMPVHPALPQVKLEPNERLEKGDSWNGSVLSIYLHAGTHVDAPWHHMPNGKGIDDIPIEDFIYQRPLLINVERGPNEFIEIKDLEAYGDELKEADILFFNTGYWKYRRDNFDKYAGDFPAVSPDAAEYIRTKLPNCKAVAIDTLSIENLNDAPNNSFFVHHAFLNHEKYSEPTMLIYEDINPEPLIGKTLKSAFSAPLRLEGYDASVVNVIVEVE
ncbi:cyclase family protein [Natribacillus halophilus]|uniref:Kynurenine formamidase n=1 Tax=Natribacillus halophilus TaxID=549003 RepID=A0A1G8KDD9_9BACI|nr:cyclase family protein [Natribacillus halophilus]SDI41476.1 Kynurenine formamidase [Natribacillus halophilus]